MFKKGGGGGGAGVVIGVARHALGPRRIARVDHEEVRAGRQGGKTVALRPRSTGRGGKRSSFTGFRVSLTWGFGVSTL